MLESLPPWQLRWPTAKERLRPHASQYLFAQFRLDLDAHHLFRGDESVVLSAKAWDTLLVLVTNRHRVVAKDELLNLVWPGRVVSEDLLPQNILALRRALGDDSGRPKFIATIPRRGYRFIAPVTAVPREGHAQTADVVDHTPAPTLSAAHTLAPGRAHVSLSPRQLGWAGVAVALALVAGTAALRLRTAPASTLSSGHPLRFAQVAPEGTTFASGAVLSPNGRYLAFVAAEDLTGKTALWVKTLDTAEARRLDGTDDAARPFWSPDSQNLGFFAGGKLKRVDLEGNAPQTLADVGLSPAGASWSPGGVILFAGWKSGLSSIADTGGRVTAVTTLDPSAQEVAHVSPQFLPDGRRFLYVVSSWNPEKAGTYAGSLDAAGRVRVSERPSTYASPGYLLTVKDRVITAQAFDPVRQRVSGPPRLIASNAPVNAPLSATGDLLAFGGVSNGSKLVWLDRNGRALGSVNAPAHLHNPTFSPDLKQLMASSSDADQHGVWIIDLERGAPTRFTPYGTSPWVSPDGQRIVFTSDRFGGVADMYARSTAGRNDEEVLLHTAENKIVNDWSPDGRYIVYVSTNPVTKKDMWLLPQFGARKPVPYLQTPANEIQGQISPDGRWMAYASDESGSWQVYVQTFPVRGRKRVVSVNGGAQPRWRRDGRELFYLAADHTLMAVQVTPGDTLEPGRPQPLFHADIFGRLSTYRSHYTVTADGQRFLVDSLNGSQPSITTLVNWTALLQQ